MSRSAGVVGGAFAVLMMLEGAALAQSVSQSELCSLEVNSFKAEAELGKMFVAENNPIRKQALEQQWGQLRHDNYKARLTLLNANYGLLGNKIVNLKGGKSFEKFTGRLEEFGPNAVGGFDLKVVIDCPQPRLWLFVRAMPNSNANAAFSDLGTLRPALQQINVGSAVDLSGMIVLMDMMSTSPDVRRTETQYWATITRIQKK